MKSTFMQRHQFAPVVVCLFVSLLLGCGGSQTKTTTTNPSNPGDNTPATPTVSITPAPSNGIAFGDVRVGKTSTITITVTNTSTVNAIVNTITLTGSSQFSFDKSDPVAPATIAASQSAVWHLTFAPTSMGQATATLAATTNTTTASVSANVTGNGIQSTLSAPSTAVDFGDTPVNNSKSIQVSVSNSGNTAASISSATFSDSTFSLGTTLPVSVAANGSTTLNLLYNPTAVVSNTGTCTLTSDASNSPTTISVKGNGIAGHYVSLTWKSSDSDVVGYTVQRSTTSGGPYTALTTSPIACTQYNDFNVTGGQTYFYVVTAVGPNATTAPAAEITATVPTP